MKGGENMSEQFPISADVLLGGPPEEGTHLGGVTFNGFGRGHINPAGDAKSNESLSV